MKQIIFLVLALTTILTSCIEEDNSTPEINIKDVSINGEEADVDNILLDDDDDLLINIELKATQKDINNFSIMYKDLNDYRLEICNIDEATTYIEGNPVSTKIDEDCSLVFKDGTYCTDISVRTSIRENVLKNTKLYLYLFSEKKVAVKVIDININD